LINQIENSLEKPIRKTNKNKSRKKYSSDEFDESWMNLSSNLEKNINSPKN